MKEERTTVDRIAGWSCEGQVAETIERRAVSRIVSGCPMLLALRRWGLHSCCWIPDPDEILALGPHQHPPTVFGEPIAHATPLHGAWHHVLLD